MDRDLIERAFQAGRIDSPTREYLVGCLDRAAATCSRDSTVYELLSLVELSGPAATDSTSTTGSDRDDLPTDAPLPFPASELRPGLAHVFRQLHANALRQPFSASSLGSVEPLLQIHSLIRVHTQSTLVSAVKQIFGCMKEALDDGVVLIPLNRTELKTPPHCDVGTWEGKPVARLPLDERFGQLFGAETVDQVLALLRRAIERFGVMLVDHFLSTEVVGQPKFQQAEEILSVLRGTSLRAILCNGFTSGTADVINPLHCLVLNELEDDRFDPSNAAWQRATIAQHIDFAVGLAMFSLDCLAQVEHLLRQPATEETTRFVKRWSDVYPNIKQKGCPFDCNYDASYFVIRHTDQESEHRIPLVDFDHERFQAAGLPGSRMLRLGCPTLGAVHHDFCELMSRAYFATALPFMLGQPSSSVSSASKPVSKTFAERVQRRSNVRPENEAIELTEEHVQADTSESSSNEVRYHYTPELCRILQHLGCSLLVTTYQAGKLLVLGVHEGKPRVSFLDFEQPMGIAVGDSQIAVGTRRQVHFLKAAHETAPSISPAGTFDGCYLPRTSSYTGAIQGHDLAFGSQGLWVVNTLFSCLCTLDEAYSFVPQWRPSFVSRLADEDRCHLNGLAMHNGEPRYVTVMGATDAPGGWRDGKADGGLVIDVQTDEVVTAGLSMPHSPRMRGDELWVLNSGHGSLGKVDRERGTFESVESMPGYTRGLCFAGQFAFVGLSKIRETSVFGGIPIAESRESLRCGIGVVDLVSGRTVAVFQFLSGVEEIFAVEVVPGFRCPFISGASEGEYERDVWVVPAPEDG